MSKTFVVVVDAQNDFMRSTGALYVPGADDLIPLINKYLKGLQSDVLGVLFTQDTHDPITYPQSEEGQDFPPHCYNQTEGWELAVTTDIIPDIHFLNKTVFDMWFEGHSIIEYTNSSGGPKKQERDIFFNNLKAQNVTTIDVLGIASDFCVKWAVEGLIKIGFNVRIHNNLCAGITQQIDEVYKQNWVKKNIILV